MVPITCVAPSHKQQELGLEEQISPVEVVPPCPQWESGVSPSAQVDGMGVTYPHPVGLPHKKRELCFS